MFTVPTSGLVMMSGKLSVIENFTSTYKNNLKLVALNFYYYKMID